MSRSVRLKQLVLRNHWQTHRIFNKEYDRAAVSIDPALKGNGPSRAQLHRWLTGDVKGLPYPDHCRVLERMFPGWSAEQLFESGAEKDEPVLRAAAPTSPKTSAGRLAGISAAFPSRAAFLHAYSPHELFDHAASIKSVGLSLNLLCQNYPDNALRNLLESGTVVQCLFLDPAGQRIADREREESHPSGVLTTLTTLNMQTLRRVQSKVPREFRDNLRIRTYDEPVRFNIIVVDEARCVYHPYLPSERGIESPTLVIDRQIGARGLFDTFSEVFASMWDRGRELP